MRYRYNGRFDRRYGPGLSRPEQVRLWRAAARGHEANGNRAEALRCWNTARLILGLSPRKVRAA